MNSIRFGRETNCHAEQPPKAALFAAILYQSPARSLASNNDEYTLDLCQIPLAGLPAELDEQLLLFAFAADEPPRLALPYASPPNPAGQMSIGNPGNDGDCCRRRRRCLYVRCRDLMKFYIYIYIHIYNSWLSSANEARRGLGLLACCLPANQQCRRRKYWLLRFANVFCVSLVFETLFLI